MYLFSIRTTINDIIRNTGGVNEAVLTSILQPVVVNIDRKLRQLTFPGTIDPNLFNIQLDRILVVIILSYPHVSLLLFDI